MQSPIEKPTSEAGTPRADPHLRPAPIKRRWAIVARAGGGAAVMAIAGALAAGTPADQGGGADPPAVDQAIVDDSFDE